MRTLAFANRTTALMKERPQIRAAIVIGVGLILLLAMLTPLITPARADGSKMPETVHVTGSIISIRAAPNIATYTITHGSTTTTMADFNTISDLVEAGSSGHGELILFATSAVDAGSTLRVVTGIATYTGTIGNSQPGLFSEILTYTVDSSNPSQVVYSGTTTVLQGSGQGGLTGICGGGTFQIVAIAPPFPGTFDNAFHFGDSCHSQG